VFGKKKMKRDSAKLDTDTAMRIVADGKIRDVSYQELLLSTNMTIEALMSILARKKIISPDEMLQEIEDIRKRQQLKGKDQTNRNDTSQKTDIDK